MKNKIIIFHHVSDLDGQVSNILFKYIGLSKNIKFESHGIEYGDLLEKTYNNLEKLIDKKSKVVILDFAINQKFLDKCSSLASDVFLYDHHQGSLKLNKRENANIFVDTNESTVSLLFKMFFHRESKNFPDLIQILKEIDLYFIENPKKLLPHQLFLNHTFMKNRPDKLEDLEYLLNNYKVPNIYYKRADNILKDVELYVKNNYKLENIKEVDCVILPKDKRFDTDIIAHYALNLTHASFCIVYFPISNGKYVHSVRKFKAIKNFDLIAFVTCFGGGGRETAGSFTLPKPII